MTKKDKVNLIFEELQKLSIEDIILAVGNNLEMKQKIHEAALKMAIDNPKNISQRDYGICYVVEGLMILVADR